MEEHEGYFPVDENRRGMCFAECLSSNLKHCVVFHSASFLKCCTKASLRVSTVAIIFGSLMNSLGHRHPRQEGNKSERPECLSLYSLFVFVTSGMYSSSSSPYSHSCNRELTTGTLEWSDLSTKRLCVSVVSNSVATLQGAVSEE